MQCRRCRHTQAVTYLPSYRLALCQECFFAVFTRKVQDTIDTYRMFAPRDRILVAVSGGKDSLVLWDVLSRIGYEAEGFYIDLGIGQYSKTSRDKIEQFATERNLRYHVASVSGLVGVGVRDAAKVAGRVPCRVCGTIKRYLMNHAAQGYACVATGHNLDDEVAQLFGNILNWQEGYLGRQWPVLETNKTLQRKVKPLTYILEQETAMYSVLRNIDYIQEECPLSEGATSLFYKGIINQIERKMPGLKMRFYKDFLRKRPFPKEEGVTLVSCGKCGYLTVAKECNFCKLKDAVSEALAVEAK